MKEYTSYTHCEAQTGIGQVVSFSCASEDKVAVKAIIEDKVRSIEIPHGHKVKVSHGGYCSYSRYDIQQYEYAGGRGGFIEIIEVKNPPDERNPFIVFEYGTGGKSSFSEWESIADALKMWDQLWQGQHHKVAFGAKGFKRFVNCGAMTPWFYAIGDEELHGDYALASGLEDDPVFRLGKKFVISEKGVVSVKTCMGCRYYAETRSHHPYDLQQWRMVYFDDGTTLRIDRDDSVTDGRGSDRITVRPLLEQEVWITHALEQFMELLSGSREGFQIKFFDGSTFTGKLAKKGKGVPSLEGDYLIKATYDGGNTKEGWVRDFVPTLELPDIVTFVRKRFSEGIVEAVKVLKHKPKKGGKKWSGVFFASPK